MSNLRKLFENISNKLFDFEEVTYDNTLPENSNSINPELENVSKKVLENANKYVYPSIDVNLEYLKVKYNTLINSDIVIREFLLTARNKEYRAFLLYIDGMVDSKIINDFILNPLMLRNRANSYDGDQNRIISEAVTNNITVRKVRKFNTVDYIYNSLLPQNSVKKIKEFESIISSVNSGNCALFIDTLDIAFDIEVKGFKQRSISAPNNEVVIRGPQEAFTEVIRTNTSLIRRIVNNEDLVIENIELGSLSKTKCAVCYMKSIANDELVAEVKNRLHNIKVDYLISSGQLEQLIEDNGKINLPQMIATERPDRAASSLLDGRIVVIVNGSPYVLIMPGVFIDFMFSPEDKNLKYQFANFAKFLRIIAFIITLLLPGFYIAITNFHQEAIPTELLFAIVASRAAVPFPIIFELIVMELSFELIREASLRVPSPIGPTMGIVGALVLGQAAVDASIVSPILIIIVAITGICSFAIPDFSLSFHCRIMRFIYIIMGYLIGFLGIAIVLFLHLALLLTMKSFGVPYLQPYLPFKSFNNKGLFNSPAWNREYRSSFLNSKKPKQQENISIPWKFPNKN